MSTPTRQQLEEIDTLLKRMLSLPPLAAEAAEPIPTPTPMSPYATPTIREIPPTSPPVPGEPTVQAWRVEFPAAQMPTPTPTPASVAAWGTPVPEQPRFTVHTPQALVPAPMPAPTGPIAYNPPPPVTPYVAPLSPTPTPVAVAERGASPLLWPVLFVNGLYDFLSYVLGPGGTWLRGSGRRMLGWLGVVMILASAGWLAGNWQGYDWPKIPWQNLDLSRFGWTK